MKISNHAHKRLEARGMDENTMSIVEAFLPEKYKNNSYHLFLNWKTAKKIAKVLRRAADKIEKHSGACLVLDNTSSILITAYRKD